jgi:pilus assembly protein CpaB
MSARRLLLALGIAFVGVGLWLAVIWLNRAATPPPQTAELKSNRPALLTARARLASGTLLREGDFGWTEIAPSEARPGHLLRGSVSETEFLGAITRRDFAEGEPLIASELLKPGDRRFLAAVLRPGYRAVSISVDAPQTASGLVLPGDYVDVILTQHFGDNVAVAAHRSVGETVLRNLRVVAIDQSLGALTKTEGQGAQQGPDARVPKTITLEADETQAQRLFVAMQLGKLQLAVRALAGAAVALSADDARNQPIWASDVSRAIRLMSVSGPRTVSSGSTVESAVRRPPPRSSQ